jgi:branched-chain amino acid transport system ATP-binding protein
MSLLSIEALAVNFGGIAAVRDLSMELVPGEIRGLIGPNGAGKTSLINAITGVVVVQCGRIKFDQQDITAQAPDRISEIGIGRTFQHVELFREQTVFENVLTGLYRHHVYGLAAAMLGLSGRAESQARREALTLLDAFELLPLAHARAGDLPFGVQKRVDMARALAVRPRLLLLDEPVSGMSEAEANETIATTRALAREREITLLIIEHNMRVIMELAERITVMHEGRVIAEGSPGDIRANAAVIDAYLGEETDDARSR